MGKRRKARENALQLLYQLEFDDSRPEKTLAGYWQNKKNSQEVKEYKEYSEWLVKGVLSRKPEIDEAIQAVSRNWRIARMAIVDRNILRIAVYELMCERTLTPAIIINEALEVAKQFSGQEAAMFINGVLDGLRKRIESGPPLGEEDKNVPKTRKRETGKRKTSQRDQEN